MVELDALLLARHDSFSKTPIDLKLAGIHAVRSSFLVRARRPLGCPSNQQMAHLGDFRLESGEVIRDCGIGYRTLGQLDASRSNAVLVTTWFQGTSRQLVRQIGPGKLVDSSRYFVIMVDAFGNGVSSSPSNSSLQPACEFPTFTIGDMVESQYQLITRRFHLTHLKAVLGISMGGMQVFQWMTAYPDFMDQGISIVGSPRSQPDDLIRLQALIQAVRAHPPWKRAVLALRQWMPRTALNELSIDANDHVCQAQAVMALDITAPFGGSMARAAAAIRATMLVVGTWQDREVNPAPAFELARMARAESLELDGRCGHQAPSCEQAALWSAVARFLDR
jgi:homoserine O-acetyltransferase